MKTEVLNLLFSISLKARILREWQKANRAQDAQFSERELLTLELVTDFGPITEKGLCKIFGLSFSSVSDMLKKLTQDGLIGDKARGKPLVLTEKGKKWLQSLKQTSATRFEYMFESFSLKEWDTLFNLFKKVEKNAERYVQQLVFDRYPQG